MLKGYVEYRADVRGMGIKFDALVFDPDTPGVEKIEISAPEGVAVTSTVHLLGVASEEAGLALARQVNEAALNRISFRYRIMIDGARSPGGRFVPVERPHTDDGAIVGAGGCCCGGSGFVIFGVTPAELKKELESPPWGGERNYGLFRSALRSSGPVEQFMHLYNILLMLNQDNQDELDRVILREDPTVPVTPSPFRSGRTETVYTRLRNEFGHSRPGVNLEDTKRDMARLLDGLVVVTRSAIERTK